MKAIRMALAALALTSMASAAQAPRFGVNGSWGSDSDIGAGGRVEVDLTNKLSKSGPLSKAYFIGQVDFFFDACSPLDCTILDINPGIAIPVGDSKMNTYVGAGLNVARVSIDLGSFGSSSNTDTGLNVLGGIRFPLGGMSGYAEGRFNLGGGEQFAIVVGVMFGKKTNP